MEKMPSHQGSFRTGVEKAHLPEKGWLGPGAARDLSHPAFPSALRV